MSLPSKKPQSSSKAAGSPKDAGKGKKVKSSVGAPAQRNQASRKGKRAWRKNVDIEDVEAGMEELRAEERVTGTTLQKQADDDLFIFDLRGDNSIRQTLPRFSPSKLTSTKILAERSAVPAVFERPTPSNKRKPGSLSRDEKNRLLRTAKRLRKGPLNSYVDPTELGAGSSILEMSEAVKKSGGYDPWAEAPKAEVGDGFSTAKEAKEAKVKAPPFIQPRDTIEIPAIAEPHQGTSYNPPAQAHQELLLKAHEIEERREKKRERLAEVKRRVEAARKFVGGETNEGVPPGMVVDVPAVDLEDDGSEAQDASSAPRKLPERKTKQQRQKAARRLAEKRVLAEKAAKKRMMATINTVKTLRFAADRTLAAREQERLQRQLVMQAKLKQGLVGHKLGKHKIPEGNVDVQLGEDLSETLRQLKPEGNLFRDRFLSLQQRGRLEPRAPVIPTRHRNKIVEYEKHAWKRFE